MGAEAVPSCLRLQGCHRTEIFSWSVASATCLGVTLSLTLEEVVSKSTKDSCPLKSASFLLGFQAGQVKDKAPQIATGHFREGDHAELDLY